MNDFIERCNAVHCELQHHEFMESYGLATIFSRTNQELATTVTYGVNVLINVIYLCFMELDPSKKNKGSGYTTPVLSDDTVWVRPGRNGTDTNWEYAVNERNSECRTKNMYNGEFCWYMPTTDILAACNWIQIILSFFTLVLFVAVRAPVEYKATYKETKSIS